MPRKKRERVTISLLDMTPAQMDAALAEEIRGKTAVLEAKIEYHEKVAAFALLEAEAGLPKPHEAVKIDWHPLSAYLGHIERMAAQGMSGSQIAARLGLAVESLVGYAERYQDVRLALTGGAARGIDEVTAAARRGALNGQSGMQRFIMESRGGYTGVTRDSDGPLVQVNVGTAPAIEQAPVSLDPIDAMRDRQMALIGAQESPTGGGAPAGQDTSGEADGAV